jgi:hypothetical protein
MTRVERTACHGFLCALCAETDLHHRIPLSCSGLDFLRFPYSAGCISYAALPQGGKKVAGTACSQFGIMQM